jgi:hypothetical protein
MILCGGSWYFNEYRVAHRGSLNPNVDSYDFGFRYCFAG